MSSLLFFHGNESYYIIYVTSLIKFSLFLNNSFEKKTFIKIKFAIKFVSHPSEGVAMHKPATFPTLSTYQLPPRGSSSKLSLNVLNIEYLQEFCSSRISDV